MAQRISFWGRFWSRFRYDTKRARETYEPRPVDPQMWQYWTGAALVSVVVILKIIYPWDLDNDFPVTQKEYDAYYANRRIKSANSPATS